MRDLAAVIDQLKQLQARESIILNGQHIWIAQLLNHEDERVREAALDLADINECQREPLEWVRPNSTGEQSAIQVSLTCASILQKVMQMTQNDSAAHLRARAFRKLSSHLCQNWSSRQAIETVLTGLEVCTLASSPNLKALRSDLRVV